MSESTNATSIPIDLLRKYDRPGPRYTSYPTAPIWTDQVGSEAYADILKEASHQVDQPLAVYCHIPFCRQRCYYCGCNTVITRDGDRVTTYVSRLMDEIDKVAKLLSPRKKVSQVHFGGGTPTFLDVDRLGPILDHLEQRFEYLPACEKSIEVDPRVTTTEQIDYLTSRGFNRISIGVQDFDPKVQQACGRIQSYELVENLMNYCRKLNFRGINIDLIYGLPNQTAASFAASLDKTITLRPDRVAVYSFAYLPTVKANQLKINPADLPATEVKYQLFATAIEKFTGADYRQIGMDHFALPDDELSVAQQDGRLHRNFMGYTVQAASEMIGFGMSSIGYIGNAFFQNHSRLDSYMNAVEADKLAVYRGMKLSDDDLIRQYLIASLMCNFRLDFDKLSQRFGIKYQDYFTQEHGRLGEFFTDGFLKETEHALEITPLGRTFLRNIAMTYDAYLDGNGRGKGPTFSRTI